jgi:hypothetical protein
MQTLEPIFYYNMNEIEAKAYKLAILFEDLAKQEFPNEQIEKLRKTGDPRKSQLFRFCYKLATETKGLIPDNEYKLYILAQLRVMKQISDGKVHAMISPQILVGDKAWVRWKMWKSAYDKQFNLTSVAESVSTTQIYKVKSELAKTKLFFTQTYKKTPSLEEITRAWKDGLIFKWINLSKISPFYIVLSPFIQKITDGKYDANFSFDLNSYRKSINDEVKEYFAKEFDYEIAAK